MFGRINFSMVLIVAVSCVGCSKFQSNSLGSSVDSLSVNNICKNNKATIKSVYGSDDRKDWFEVNNKTLLNLAKASVALVDAANITEETSDFKLRGLSLQANYNLCANEKFAQQPDISYCSGFLVARDIVVTAGHCIVNETDCKKTKFVFDYAMDRADKSDFAIAKDKVFNCSSIIHREQSADSNDSAPDFAVIKLDREVKDRTPLNVRRSGSLNVGEELLLIGHPLGLPSKISLGGKVKTVDSGRIHGLVDAFAGNSGSVVLNPMTRKVEGILVLGLTDFKEQNGCKVAAKYGSEAEGESIVPIEKVLSYIPNFEYSSADPAAIDEPICSIE